MSKVGAAIGKCRSAWIVLGIIAFFAVSLPARSQSKETISATITVNKTAKVGNTELAAGEYKVTVEGGQAKFGQGKKVVAQAPCTLKDLSYTPKLTQFLVDDNGRIVEIQIAGKTKAIDFSS